MFTALALTMAIGAPVPAPAAPVAAGVAPRVMELKANADGKIMVTVTRMEKIQIGGGAAIAPAAPPGGAAPVPAVITREVRRTSTVELGDVKDLTITTADGKKVTTEEAMKKIATGAIVVISGDGKAVSPAFLKVFKDETLVLASPELAAPQQMNVIRPGGPIGPGGIRPLPGGGIQIQGGAAGGIQIQVAPAILPAGPVAPPAAVPPVPVKPGK